MSAVASALASAVALPLQLVAPLAQQRNARQQNAQLQQNGKKPKLCDLPLSWTPSSGTVTPSIKQKKSIKQINLANQMKNYIYISLQIAKALQLVMN